MAANTDEKPICFICHDDDENEDLLCGVCSCRGGSGYSHFSCMVEHGKMKLNDVMSSNYFDADIIRSAW
jgi:E3 ubiquitin-protein ligase DOA10